MLKTFYLAKILQKLHISSFNHCRIDPTARVASGCALTMVVMGRYSYAGNNNHITGATIGNFCSIGDNCSIGGGVHPTNLVSTSPVFLKGKNILKKNFSLFPHEDPAKVLIGHDVWIGDGAYIKAGVKIGTGAVIGAHAVVTHDINPYAVVAGVPAKEIRKRFDQDIIDQLLGIQWWEWPDEKIEENAAFFIEPGKLIEESKNRC